MSAPKIEEKLAAIPHICTMGELIVHCVCAKAIIDKYRRAARPVVNFWGECDELIGLALHGGKEYRHKCLVFKKGQIILPSGMPMNYPNLHVEPVYDENNNLTGRRWVYGPQDKFTALYGGKVTNNVTQGTARCVMTDGMLRTAKRFPVVGTVHDEQIVLLPEEGVEEAYKWVMAQMVMEPPYMPGIPLAASGGHARRYGEAK